MNLYVDAVIKNKQAYYSNIFILVMKNKYLVYDNCCKTVSFLFRLVLSFSEFIIKGFILKWDYKKW